MAVKPTGRRWLAWLAWALLGIQAALLLPIYLLGPAARPDLPPILHFGWWETLAPLLGFELGVVGALIVRRYPSHGVGWIAVVSGFATTLNGFAGAYTGYSSSQVHPLPATALALWTRGWLWYPALALLSIVLPLYFPNGSLLSRRWRPIVWAVVAGSVAQVLLVTLTQALFGFPQADGPYARLDWLLEPLSPIAGLLLFSSLVAVVVALWQRFRRSGGAGRQQLKWFLFAVAAQAVLWCASGLMSTATGLPPYQNPYFDVLIPVSTLLIPVAIGVAILRYRLYDIDLVISRSLAYAGLATFIAAAYIAIVIGVGLALGQGKPDLALSVAATAVVALAIQPVRGRLEMLANQLVYGIPRDPYAVLAEIAKSPASSNIDVALGRIARALAGGNERRPVRIRIRLPGAGERSAVWPPGSGGSFGQSFQITDEGQVVGEIEADALGDPGLADALLVQAALAARTLRLSADLAGRLNELEAQAHELAASRTRLVQAEEAERRRLERDLHDGIQQELVVLIAKARLARNQLERDASLAAKTLSDLQNSAGRALAELRALVRGIHPAVLTSRGLVEAIEAVASRAPLDVRVEASQTMRGVRLAPDIEGAAYFVAAEALSNVIKHAGATKAEVGVSSDERSLRLTVCDDGHGYDSSRVSESGLRGLRDRVEALGGHLLVVSSRSGTRLEMSLPLSQNGLV